MRFWWKKIEVIKLTRTTKQLWFSKYSTWLFLIIFSVMEFVIRVVSVSRFCFTWVCYCRTLMLKITIGYKRDGLIKINLRFNTEIEYNIYISLNARIMPSIVMKKKGANSYRLIIKSGLRYESVIIVFICIII